MAKLTPIDLLTLKMVFSEDFSLKYQEVTNKALFLFSEFIIFDDSERILTIQSEFNGDHAKYSLIRYNIESI